MPTARAITLCIPSDRGAVGLEEVGLGYVVFHKDGMRYISVTCPKKPGGPRQVLEFNGLTPGVWQLVGDWTTYAVCTVDGEVLYAPPTVWRWAKREPRLWE